MQPLRRDVDVDAALAVRDGEARLGPEERLILRGGLVVRRCTVTSPSTSGSPWVITSERTHVRPRVVAVAVTHRGTVGMQRLLLRRALGVDDRLQRLVLDHDRLGGATRLLGVLGRDEGDRLAVVPDALERENRLVGELQAVRLARPGRRRASGRRGLPAA